MQCQECGTEVDTRLAVCPKCGNELGSEAAAKTPSAQERFRNAAESRRQDDDDEERSIWEGRFSAKALIGSWILAGLVTTIGLLYGMIALRTGFAWGVLLLSILGLWAILAVRFLFLYLQRKYVLTNQRLVQEQGILWKTIDRIELIDVDDITFKQNPLQRLVDCGTIEIMSSDVSHGSGRTAKSQGSEAGMASKRNRDDVQELLGIENIRAVVELIERQRREERRKRAIHMESV